MVQVEGVVGRALYNGIIDIRIRYTDPRVAVRALLYDLVEVDRAFDRFRLLDFLYGFLLFCLLLRAPYVFLLLFSYIGSN